MPKRKIAMLAGAVLGVACAKPTPSPIEGAELDTVAKTGTWQSTDTLMFQYGLLLVKDSRSRVIVYALAETPDICFEPGVPPVEPGPPQGVVVSPESHALRFNVRRVSLAHCAPMRWPVTFAQRVENQPAQSTLSTWLVVGGHVAGSASVPLNAAIEASQLTERQRRALSAF